MESGIISFGAKSVFSEPALGESKLVAIQSEIILISNLNETKKLCVDDTVQTLVCYEDQMNCIHTSYGSLLFDNYR